MFALLIFGIIILCSIGVVVYTFIDWKKNNRDAFKFLGIFCGIVAIVSFFLLFACLNIGATSVYQKEDLKAEAIALLLSNEKEDKALGIEKATEYNKFLDDYNNLWYKFSIEDLSKTKIDLIDYSSSSADPTESSDTVTESSSKE